MSDSERLLQEDEHSKELVTGPYRDTEIEAKIHGPDVTSDEYCETLKITRLNPDSRSSVHGWTMLTLPTDPEAIDEFISVLMRASLRLQELRAVDTVNDHSTNGGNSE